MLISVIIPTYHERENLPELIQRIQKVRSTADFELELIIVDDDSQDGTEEYIHSLGLDWCQIIVRHGERGLSSAVLRGFQSARGEIFIVMDADLSHPPEKIVDMVHAIRDGADMVVGSRYVPGAKTDEEWGILRWLNSKVATILAKPLTSVKDPMSGFFAIRREKVESAPYLNPTGYKIGLELLVKCHLNTVVEIPIYFAQRAHGKSKLNLKEQIKYLIHLRRLYFYKYETLTYFLHFSAIGFSGTIVNLVVLSLLVYLDIPVRIAVAIAIVTAMISNFQLNRWFTFPHAKEKPWFPQLLGFMSACSIGAIINYVTVLLLLYLFPVLEHFPQLPALVGILAGLLFNFIMSKNIIFKK